MPGSINEEAATLRAKSFLVGKPLLYFTSCFVSLGVSTLLFGISLDKESHYADALCSRCSSSATIKAS